MELGYHNASLKGRLYSRRAYDAPGHLTRQTDNVKAPNLRVITEIQDQNLY